MKLNNCPVCGSDNIRYNEETYNGMIDSRLIVECNNCDTKVFTYGRNIQEARDRYNSICVYKEK